MHTSVCFFIGFNYMDYNFILTRTFPKLIAKYGYALSMNRTREAVYQSINDIDANTRFQNRNRYATKFLNFKK